MDKVSLHNYTHRVLIALGLTVLVGIILALLWAAQTTFFLVFLSMLLAIFWRSVSRPLIKFAHVPEPLAVGITVLVLALLFGLALWLLVPSVMTQGDQFVDTLPSAIGQLEETIRQLPYGPLIMEQLPTQGELEPQGDILPQAVSTFNVISTVVANLVLVFFVALFFALSPELYRSGLIKLVPKGGRERAREVLDTVSDTLGAWLIGRLISMAAVGILVTIGLWIMGIPLALFMGLLAALLDFIPFIGPFVAAVPAVLFAFADSPITAVWVALLYLGVQQVESYLVTPIVQQRAVHLPPVLTIIAVYVFGELFGILGLLVATPLFAVILVLVKMLYIEDALKDEVEV
jgi:predicted PurR-regulated permease PerM